MNFKIIFLLLIKVNYHGERQIEILFSLIRHLRLKRDRLEPLIEEIQIVGQLSVEILQVTTI